MKTLQNYNECPSINIIKWACVGLNDQHLKKTIRFFADFIIFLRENVPLPFLPPMGSHAKRAIKKKKKTKTKLRSLSILSTNSVGMLLRILYLGFGAYYVLPLNIAIIIYRVIYVPTSTRYLDADDFPRWFR